MAEISSNDAKDEQLLRTNVSSHGGVAEIMRDKGRRRNIYKAIVTLWCLIHVSLWEKKVVELL